MVERPAVTTRLSWILAGLVAGLAGLGTSYLVAAAMSLRLSPIPAVAELVIRLTPGSVVEAGVQNVGTNDKPLLVAGTWVVLLVAFVVIGLLARRLWWVPTAGFAVLAVIGAIAYLSSPGGSATDLAPIVVGYLTWMVAISVITERLRSLEGLSDLEAGQVAEGHARRVFLGATAAFGVVAAGGWSLGLLAGGSRRRTEEARSTLRLPVTAPVVPAYALVAVDGVSSWMTPADDFYLIDTAVVKPTIEPKDWALRIHGMVEKEIMLTYDDLVGRELTEDWVTLNCVSNPVGGQYIGNAWWSGVRLDALLAEAKPLAGADAVLQTSDDGWTCGTPLSAMTDGRNAMLAVAMNGRPMPIEHGFPVRTIVPGLYGYVSACKWVVDMEVTQFSQFSAFWTKRGWGEQGPVKMSSRIEVPQSGASMPSGTTTVAGTAWSQHTGIAAVEVQVDGGAWQQATLAGVPSTDCWVQWRADVDLPRGVHALKVRATDKDGLVQTGVRRDVLPDGSTGWDQVQVQGV